MQSAEYEEILVAAQALVRRAYALGRSEALKQVIDVMQTDEAAPKPLALTGPSGPAPAAQSPEAAAEIGVHAGTGAGSMEGAPGSWWMRPPRPAAAVVERATRPSGR